MSEELNQVNDTNNYDTFENETINEPDNNKIQNEIEDYKKTLIQEQEKVTSLLKDLQERTEERDNLKNQTIKLEKELIKKSLKGKNAKQHPNSDKDVVARASSVIFEKTKVCKNQELQIEALSQQVKSLKEIVTISKDMLEIRNMEVKQLQDKLDCMELKFEAEKDRQGLINAKLERMVKLNEDLKTEYEKQLVLFLDLQKAYHKQKIASQKIE